MHILIMASRKTYVYARQLSKRWVVSEITEMCKNEKLPVPRLQSRIVCRLLMPPCLLSLCKLKISVVESKVRQPNEHTENTDDIFSLANLPRYYIITFLQSAFFSLKNLEWRVVHHINNTTQPPNTFEWQEVDQKPPESGGTDLHEHR